MDEHNDEQNSVNPADYGTPLHTLRDYLAICFRRRRLVLFTFLGIFVVSALFALDELLDHQYQAEIKFLVKKERIDPMLTPESNLQQRIKSLLDNQPVASKLDTYSRAHLQESAARIAKVLDARYQLPTLSPSRSAALLVSPHSRRLDQPGSRGD